MAKLAYIGEGDEPWFPPDRIGNFRTDVPEDANLVVRDVNGVAICGRVVPGSTAKHIIYANEWELING